MQQLKNSFSQIGQDLIVLDILKNKTEGTFVDIGCAGPTRFSNSCLLEKEYNWSGIGVDIINETDGIGEWKDIRPKTKHIIHDALTLNYEDLFKKLNMPSHMNYLSLDLEPPELTLECLFKIPFKKYSFDVITFETDEYRPGGEDRVNKSRTYLKEKGYILLASIGRQDDVYINKNLER